MKKLSLLVAAVLMTGSLMAQVKYEVDSDASVIEWKGQKIVGGSHEGTIQFTSGTLKVNGNKLVGGDVVADMTTISDADGSAKLEGHLKSNDFFGVEDFPTSTLTIIDVTNGQVTAKLTIKEATEELTFPAEIEIKNGKLTATAELTFDRSKFDVRYGSDSFFDNLGNKAISNDIQLKVKVIAAAPMR